MATAERSAVSRCTYDVFLSFRGKDTRKNFTDHLYSALKQAGFHTFRDDDEIMRGENIEAELHKAIRESKVSLVVFSKDYASSPWCLDELVIIMKRMSGGGHTVLPIFYGVPPSDVRYQTGSFASSFRKHKKKFKKEIDKINQWKAALKDAADLGGMELNNRYESHLIQDVVREMRNKFNPGKLDLTPHLVGTNLSVKEINSWLQDKSHDASMAIIYGIGGIGKTTIAKILYNENLKIFESSSFIANVRDFSKAPNGLIRLQNQLLSDILKGKMHEVHNIDDGIIKIRNAICCKKVLVIFDDVDESDQLDALLGRQILQLCPGSKIIFTTRHERLLRANQVFVKFQVKGLDENDSLQLFSWHAFGQNTPVDSYLKCSKEVVNRCKGLPLALEVLGSSLFGRNIDVWKDALKKLEVIPDSKIQRILRISYDSLKDDHDQNLFLHITCFFVGMEKNHVIGILNGCGFYTSVGIQNLVDRCLLSVYEDNKVRVHQLLAEMGREIVRQESVDNPGKRSRIWKRRDAWNVLQDKTGTEKIKGLVLDSRRLVESSYITTVDGLSYEKHEFDNDFPTREQTNVASSQSLSLSRMIRINLQAESFRKMNKLQILQLYGISVEGDYDELPKNLVLLFWHGFPLKSIPNSFHLEKLVSLNLSYSDIKSVWDATMVFPELKFLNLSYCRQLTSMPNFRKLPCVERLSFEGCIKISEVGESIDCLKRLQILNLNGCSSLRRLPKNFTTLKSLEEIHLYGCSNLNELPEDLGKMESLKVFHASGIAVNQFLSTTTSTETRIVSLLSSSLWHPTIQSWLTLRKRSRSTNFSIASLPCSLVRLTLKNCNLSDDDIPCDLSSLKSLISLNLSENPFCSLPESINSLTALKSLTLNKSTRIKSLPKLPINLMLLLAKYYSSLERIESRQLFSRLLQLHVDHCDKLVEIQGLFKIESIDDIDEAILISLGFSNLESLENIMVDMINGLTFTRKTTSLQVLHECGILNIFVPGNDVPNCFSLQRAGSWICFDIPLAVGHKIYGLNLCILYGVHHDLLDLPANPLFVKITNTTKEARWSYNPTCYAIPRVENNIQWLSSWRFGDQMQGGDQVYISVIAPDDFLIKTCGISFVYEVDPKSAKEIVGELAWNQNPLYSDLKQEGFLYFNATEHGMSQTYVPFGETKASIEAREAAAN